MYWIRILKDYFGIKKLIDFKRLGFCSSDFNEFKKY